MSRATVLIADDSQDIRTIVKYSLMDLGYGVVEASDGHEAVRLARQHCPMLILLDLCMPGLDGWEVTARLRADPALEDVPIIAMTAYDVSPAVRAAISAGCQQVIVKPFDLHAVTDKITALLSPRESSALQYA